MKSYVQEVNASHSLSNFKAEGNRSHGNMTFPPPQRGWPLDVLYRAVYVFNMCFCLALGNVVSLGRCFRNVITHTLVLEANILRITLTL